MIQRRKSRSNLGGRYFSFDKKHAYGTWGTGPTFGSHKHAYGEWGGHNSASVVKVAESERFLNAKQIAHLYGVYPSAVSNWRSRSYLNFPEQAQPGLWSHTAIQNWAEGRCMTPAADIEEVMAVPRGVSGPKGPTAPVFNPHAHPPTHMEPYGEPDVQEQPWEGRKRTLNPPTAWDDQWGEGADPMDTINPPYGTVWGKVAYPMGFQDMYHVSPRKNREKILQEGLQGQEREQVGSPWNYTWEQPPGNYLFDNPEDAHDYIYSTHTRNNRLDQEPDWEERFEAPEPPEDFHQWPEDKQDEWHDNSEYKERTDDPNGWDIWKVKAHGLPMAPDPEARLTEDDPFDLGNVHDIYQEQAARWREQNPLDEGTHLGPEELHADVGGWYGNGPKRYYTPQGVHPSRVQLHEHVPSWNLTTPGYEERMDNQYEREYPAPWAQLPMTEWPMPGHESKTAETKTAYGEQYDPTICQHCWGRMGPPKQVGGTWMNTCTNCGRTRAVPPNSPLLKQQQQDWPQYPDLLEQVSQPRPWFSFKTPSVTSDPKSPLPNGHHEQSNGGDVNQPPVVKVPDGKQSRHLNAYELAEKRARAIISAVNHPSRK